MKIAICIPTNRTIKGKTANSVLRLIAHSKFDYEILVSTRGYNTSENRNWLASQAVKRDCHRLFFVDDDMILPEDTLDRLLATDKDIIGAVYNTKYEIQTPVIEYLIGDDEKLLKEKEIFKCGAIGTGCLLIATRVFRKIPPIWFNYEWNDNGSVKMSHDWYFCYKARKCGYDIWADSSIPVGHIGLREY